MTLQALSLPPVNQASSCPLMYPMGYQVVEDVSSLEKKRCVTFVGSGPIWPMFYRSFCMVWCQNKVQAPWCPVEQEIGCVILHTLAGQVGLGV